MSRRSTRKNGLGFLGMLQVTMLMMVCGFGCLLLGAYNSRIIVYCLDGHMKACVDHVLPKQETVTP